MRNTSQTPKCRKHVRLVVGFSVAAIMLAGCGGSEPVADDEPGETSAPEPTDGETTTADADGTSSPLEGETIDFAVPYPPGGGYDQYARIMAPYLEQELGATVVVVNEPGAGGQLSLNNTEAAEPDGTRIQILEGASSIASQLGGSPGARYDLSEWEWIGRIVAEPDMVLTPTNGDLGDWDAVLAADELVFGSAGAGGGGYIHGTVLQGAFDLPIELVTGFEGGPDIVAGMLRGDVDMASISLGTSLSTIEEGDAQPVAVIFDERAEGFEDVPTVLELELVDPSYESTLRGVVNLGVVGRAIGTAPGTPTELVEAHRAAFNAVMENPDFQADVEAVDRPLLPLDGAELTEVVDGIFPAEGPFADLMEEIYGGE